MSATSRTTPADEWERLMELMGAGAANVDGKDLVWTSDEDETVVIARATIEPLFVWDYGERRVTWTTPRRDVAREVRPPRHAGDACALAYAAARTFGAVSVHLRPTEEPGQEAFALTSFQRTSNEPAREREAKSRVFVAEQLEQCSKMAVSVFAQHGSGGARTISREVSTCADLVAAVSAHYVADLPLGTELNALVSQLDVWALRAGVPTDEALHVGAELGREANRWRG